MGRSSLVFFAACAAHGDSAAKTLPSHTIPPVTQVSTRVERLTISAVLATREDTKQSKPARDLATFKMTIVTRQVFTDNFFYD